MKYKASANRRIQEALYTLLRSIIVPFFSWRFHLSADREPKVDFPYVVVSNHVTELDFIFVAKVFKRPMGFIVGQGLLQNKLLATFLIKFLGCVPKQKGTSDARTALSMMQRIRQGRCLCLFAEGNTTFDGKTDPISPVTGGLLKALKAGLITCRIEGGYFSLPRWGKRIRRGKTSCHVTGVYSPEQLQGMSNQDINDLIQHEISTDAYEEQVKSPVAFRGKNSASGMEHVLYLCPGCKQFNTLYGKRNEIYCCSCNLHAKYTEYGSFSDNLPFSGVNTWSDWQKNFLQQIIAQESEDQIFSDEEHTMLEQLDDGALHTVSVGRLWLSKNQIGLGQLVFHLSEIKGLEIFRKNILQIVTFTGKYYQTANKKGFNALKYRDAFQMLSRERNN